MRAVLLHNPLAGVRGLSLDGVLDALRAIGWSVEQQEQESLEDVLARKPDVVVVAGGDGTVADVAKRCRKSETPIAIVPTGTANNIASSLGLDRDDPLDALRGLDKPRELRVDLGAIDGDAFFLEAVGVGAFATLLRSDAWRDVKSVHDARATMAQKLGSCAPVPLTVTIDGSKREGEYLFATVLNARSFGPILAFAPHAKMDDGMLDVVLLDERARGELVTQLERGGRAEITPTAARVARGREVRIAVRDGWAHLDDRAIHFAGEIEMRVVPNAVRFLVPSKARR